AVAAVLRARLLSFFFFFFQAEDGIRDWSVTGVQTCALPISSTRRNASSIASRAAADGAMAGRKTRVASGWAGSPSISRSPRRLRSEERRVGKECRSRGAPDD